MKASGIIISREGEVNLDQPVVILRRRRQGRALKLDTITGFASCVKRICPIYRQLEAHVVAWAKSLLAVQQTHFVWPTT